MCFDKSATKSALIDLLVILPPVTPFAFLVGISAFEFGFDAWLAPLSSIAIFAGGAQIAQFEVLSSTNSIWLSILIVAIINSRQLMYSASLAPIFSDVPRSKRLALSYLLTDQAYAFTMLRKTEGFDNAWLIKYYATFGFYCWLYWQFATILGIYIGHFLPTSFPAQSIIPLVFLSMAAIAIKNKAHIISFAVGATIAVVFDFLPYRTGLLLGAICGILAGVLWDIKKGRLKNEQ